MNAITTSNNYELMEKVIAEGDLSKLTAQERLIYYNKTCESLKLNPLTKPFSYIKMNGKLVLYANKDATEQLRKVNKVSIVDMTNKVVNDVYIVTVKARTAEGVEDIATGAVNIKGLVGDALANAFLKCETKSKRRVTLSICGLGITDESEISAIPNAQLVSVDPQTGEIEQPKLDENKVDSMKISINKAASMDELKNAYQVAYTYWDHPDYRDEITQLKDKRKAELTNASVLYKEASSG